MPAFTIRIGGRSFSINARGKRGALILARSMLTKDLSDNQSVTIVEGDGDGGAVIFTSTVGTMVTEDIGRAQLLRIRAD